MVRIGTPITQAQPDWPRHRRSWLPTS